MYKKNIKYTDFNGNECSEDFYFNLSASELMRMQVSKNGGLAESIVKASKANDMKTIFEIVEDFIEKSYGVRSEDGKRFSKDPKHFEEFKQSPAYDVLFMELITDDTKASEFINGVVPVEVQKAMQSNENRAAIESMINK